MKSIKAFPLWLKYINQSIGKKNNTYKLYTHPIQVVNKARFRQLQKLTMFKGKSINVTNEVNSISIVLNISQNLIVGFHNSW